MMSGTLERISDLVGRVNTIFGRRGVRGGYYRDFETT